MKRDKTRSKSKLFWIIKAYQEHIQDLCMTPRQSRKAWGDLKSPIETLGFRTQLMRYHIPIWSTYLRRRNHVSSH